MFKSLLLKGRTLCLLLCCMISSLVVTAQTKHSGKVIGGDDKQPLVGAAVRIKGTNLGTVTDVNGEFALALSPGQTLVVSYLTYQTQEISVSNDQYLTITLQPSNTSLNEVVVTGYAVQKKKDLVGAVSVVDVAAANRQPTGSVENQLQGQAAGVTVITSGQPGEAPQVKIRGSNTFGNNTPLYVVDGVPTTNITDINPNDVANMQVLKDAGSASIYGSRAANGVIVITTKKGSGKVNITYDGYYGSQVPKGGNVWDILTPQEMVTLQHNAITNTATKNGTTPNYSSALYGPNGDTLPDYINPAGAHEGDASVNPSLYNVNPFYPQGTDITKFYRITRANKQGTDWYHEIFKTAPMTSQNVALSGSTDLASYLFSLNYFNQRGTLLETYDKRYTIRANTSFNVTKHFRVGENLSYSATQNPTKQSENNEGSTIGFGFREQPIIPVHDIAGNYAGTYTAGLGNGTNPVADAERTKNNFGVDTRLFGNVFAEADFAKYFTIRTQFGGEYYSGYYHSFTYPQYENSENGVTNAYYEQSDNGYNYTWTNTLKFARVMGKHNLQVLVGTEAYAARNEFLSAQNTDYFSFDPNYVNIGAGAGVPTASSSLEKDKLFSYIGRLDYTFNDKYLLNATIRRDGSSRFLNNQTGWFPAASIGWRISQEDFMKGISWINDLKIRGGYGSMGNQINVTPSNAFTTYNPVKTTSYYDITGSSTGTVLGIQKTQIGNPDATWEKDKNLNIGFDGTFFNQKLEVTADYYKKDITGLLYNPALPGTSGAATAPYTNVGAMTNHGFDISVATHGNFTSDLKFNAALTVTTYHNTINAISTGSDFFEVDAGRFGTGIIRNAVGHPLSSFFGYQVDGFWNSQGEIDAANAAAAAKYGAGTTYQDGVAVGRFKYKDVNGDGVIDSRDRTFLGSPNPKFTSGFNFDLTYKQWDFNMFWYWNYGSKIFDDIKWWTDFYPDFGGAKSKTALYDSWTPTHMNASAPIAETESSSATSTVPNSYFIQPGSFLRLKNTQIGYSFAPAALKSLGMSKLRVYVSGANLFTITKYKGPDPEITGTTADFGIDRGNYSPVRTYLIGAQVKF